MTMATSSNSEIDKDASADSASSSNPLSPVRERTNSLSIQSTLPISSRSMKSHLTNQFTQACVNMNSLRTLQSSQLTSNTNSCGMPQSHQPGVNVNNLGMHQSCQPSVNMNDFRVQQSGQPSANMNNLGIHEFSQSVSVNTNNSAQLTFPCTIYPLNKLCLVQVPRNIVLSSTNNENNAESTMTESRTKANKMVNPNLVISVKNEPNTMPIYQNTAVNVSNTNAISNTTVNNSSILNNGVTGESSVTLNQTEVQNPVVLKPALNVPRAVTPNLVVLNNAVNHGAIKNYFKKNFISDNSRPTPRTQSQNKTVSENTSKTALPDMEVTKQSFSVIIQPVQKLDPPPVQNFDPPQELENVQVKIEESPVVINELQSDIPVRRKQRVDYSALVKGLKKDSTDKRTKKKKKRTKNRSKAGKMKFSGFKFYKCGICNEAFSDPLFLQTHIRHHKGFQSELIKCGYCEKIFTSKNGKTGVFAHLQGIHGIICEKPRGGKEEVNIPTYESDGKLVKTIRVIPTKIPICKICGIVFPNMEALTQHKEKSECAEVWYCCVLCGQPIHYEMSEEVQPPKELKCNLCCGTGNQPKMNTDITEQNKQGNGITSGELLPGITDFNHKKSTKNEKKLYHCVECEKFYTQKSSYQMHLKLLHGTVKSHKCDLCDKAYVVSSSLKAHRLSHTRMQTFACDKCPKTFILKYALKRHIDRKHKPTQFSCDVCGKKLKCKWKLIAHMRLHTGEKPFLCEICGRRFHNRMSRVLHMNTHNSSSKSLCEICGKLYMYKSSLRFHQIRHRLQDDLTLDVKSRIADVPYVCEICGKGFCERLSYEKHKLNRHEHKNKISHLKENRKKKKNPSGPVLCDICGKSFANKSSLNSHTRLHLGLMRVACEKCNMVMHTQSLRRHMLKMHKTSIQ